MIPFEPYAAILKAAHLVIARAGLSTIAELSALSKVAIIIPMPQTHQEENAKILMDAHAAVVLNAKEAIPANLKQILNSLKFNAKRGEAMGSNISHLIPKDASKRIAAIITKQ
ncbi:MAG: hypothetical protein A3K08_02205 [Candidatus Doudnabacteria bacterium RIFCSPLOWO2_01_41_7]|nr:MAG: hypothetical protein A3K08_02205 [Candidatus Doudnabacteria bacterium RIFCSPLOWO2_01_41_7]